MNQLAVGQPFIPGRTRFPEGAVFNFERGGVTLTLFVRRPTPKERRDVQGGTLRIGLLTLPPTLLVPFRFGSMPWSEATYSPHLVPPERRPALDLAPDHRLLAQIALVDADTGLVEGLRAVALPPEMSRRLVEETQRLLEAPWPGRAAYDAWLNRLFASMSSEQIAKTAETWTL